MGFGVVGPPLGGRLVGVREAGHATTLEEGPRLRTEQEHPAGYVEGCV